MNHRTYPAPLLGLGLAALLAGASSASAGEIKGRATDSVGGALLEALLSIENTATGVVTVARANPEGGYSFPGLSAGTYRLVAEAPGFSQVARVITLAAEAETADVDLQLRIGNLQTEVTVTALRSARDSLVVPLRAESLGSSLLASANPASSGDLMVEATGVTPVGSGPFQTRPRLRGLDSTRVLVLVDGERLNNARTATDRAGVEVGLVDASSIESIEVVSGSGSVLYGTDALSGTVNIRTEQPQFSDQTRLSLGLNGYYSSNEDGRRGNLALGLSGRRYALSLSGGKEKFDNYRSGGKDGSVLEDSRPLFANQTLTQADTADTFFGFDFKAFPDPFNAPFVRTSTEVPTSFLDGTTVRGNALFALDATQTIRVKYFHREARDVGFPDFVPPQFFQGIVLPHSDLDKVSARYETHAINSWFSHLSATAYYQKQDRLLRNINIPVQFPAPAPTFFPISIFRLIINSDTGQKVETQGFDTQATFLLSPRNVLIAGATYYKDDSADYRTSTTSTNLVGQVVLGARGPAAVVFPALLELGPPSVSHPTRVPDASFADFGVFAQDEWNLTDRIRLVAGARLDNYRVETDPTAGYNLDAVVAGTTPAINPATLPNPNGDRVSRTAFTGDVGVVVRQSDRLSFIAHYGRSYRHPNLEELLFAGPATVGSIAPNITVGPERGDNADLGVKFRSAQVQGSVSYFNNRYSDFISTEITALTASSSVSQAINFSDVRIQGLEADFQGSWEQGPAIVNVFANGSYNKGDVLKGTNPLTGASIANTPQDNITPFKSIAGLRLSDRRQRFWGEYSFRYQKKVDRVAATLKDSPFLIFQDLAALEGFAIHRIGLGYDWAKDGTTFGVTVNVENLTNKFYREQFQFAPARGRSLTLGVRVRTR